MANPFALLGRIAQHGAEAIVERDRTQVFGPNYKERLEALRQQTAITAGENRRRDRADRSLFIRAQEMFPDQPAEEAAANYMASLDSEELQRLRERNTLDFDRLAQQLELGQESLLRSRDAPTTAASQEREDFVREDTQAARLAEVRAREAGANARATTRVRPPAGPVGRVNPDKLLEFAFDMASDAMGEEFDNMNPQEQIQTVQPILQGLLQQFGAGGEEAAAGEAPFAPPEGLTPETQLPPGAAGILGQFQASQAAGAAQPNSAFQSSSLPDPSQVQEGSVATSNDTGESFILRNGRWEPQ